jgi:hypothetical protein
MQNDDHLIFEAFKKKWKLTSMDPKQAEAEFGKENVKVTPKGLRNGKDMIEVNVPDEDAESADEKKERVQRGWDINKKRWAKWKAENPEAAAKHAARKAGKSEDAENARPDDVSYNISTKLGQAYNIVKGLIDMLDKTPTGQTPYNEMAITHIVNLEEDVKTLSQMLQDRMLKK